MVAKKRLGVGYEYGGLQIQTAEEIATGLGCNFIQRVMKNNSKEKKLFMTTRLNDLLISQGLPCLGELYQIGGTNIWKKAQSKLKAHIAFLSFAYGSMAKLLEISEKSQESKLIANIAGNALAPPIYAMTLAEGLTLRELYGLEKVAQLFLIDNITEKSDLSKDCIYPEAMVQRDPGLIIKCRALRKEIEGRGGFVHAPPYKVTDILEKENLATFS